MSTLIPLPWVGLKGRHYEALALRYLKTQGLRLVERNYRCAAGEIDLIMLDKRTLVFVEVRFRDARGFGSAIDTVDRRKQQKVRRAAQHYLLLHKIYDSCRCRFDVIGITKNRDDTEYLWLPDAFE